MLLAKQIGEKKPILAIRTLNAAVASLDREEGRGLQLSSFVAREIECPLVIEEFTLQLYVPINCITL